jgi:hypothetical protein
MERTGALETNSNPVAKYQNANTSKMGNGLTNK